MSANVRDGQGFGGVSSEKLRFAPDFLFELGEGFAEFKTGFCLQGVGHHMQRGEGLKNVIVVACGGGTVDQAAADRFMEFVGLKSHPALSFVAAQKLETGIARLQFACQNAAGFPGLEQHSPLFAELILYRQHRNDGVKIHVADLGIQRRINRRLYVAFLQALFKCFGAGQSVAFQGTVHALDIGGRKSSLRDFDSKLGRGGNGGKFQNLRRTVFDAAGFGDMIHILDDILVLGTCRKKLVQIGKSGEKSLAVGCA